MAERLCSRPARRVAVFLLACMVVASACGDSAPSPPGAQDPVPAPGGAFVPKEFSEIPKPSTVRPVDTPFVTPRAVTQSYTVVGLTAGDVMSFYASQLPPLGWVPVGDNEILGRRGAKAEWKRNDTRLEITATGPDPAASSGPAQSEPTQLDLVMTWDEP